MVHNNKLRKVYEENNHNSSFIYIYIWIKGKLLYCDINTKWVIIPKGKKKEVCMTESKSILKTPYVINLSYTKHSRSTE